MARVKGTTLGWETGLSGEDGGIDSVSNVAISVVSSTPTPRTGSYCLRFFVPNNFLTAFGLRKIVLPAAAGEYWFRVPIFPSISAEGQEIIFFRIDDEDGVVHLTFTVSAVDNLIRVRFGNFGGLMGTSSAGIVQDAWNLIEIRHLCHDTTGIVEVWLGGTRVINLTGIDTKASAKNIRAFDLAYDRTSGSNSVSNKYIAFDDIAVNDTTGSVNNGRPGDAGIYYLPPNAAGDVTQLTRGGTDSGANWSQVDEVPIGTTDDVRSSTDGQYDLYNITNTPVAGTINAVELIAYAQKSDAGTAGIALMLKSGGTEDEGARQELNTANKFYRELHEQNPVTAAAWTTSSVDSLQVGAKVKV